MKDSVGAPLDDREIVALFWARDEHAIEETNKKYKSYFDDAYYIIEYGSNECKAIERDALLELLDNQSEFVYKGAYDENGKIVDRTMW